MTDNLEGRGVCGIGWLDSSIHHAQWWLGRTGAEVDEVRGPEDLMQQMRLEFAEPLSLVLCGHLRHFPRPRYRKGIEMRFLAILAVSAAVLMPALATADPVQPETAPAAQAQATPAAPAQQTAQATPVASTSESDLDRVECRTGTPPTGTRLGATRTCHTVREWDNIQKNSQTLLKNTQMNGHQFGLANPVSGTK